MVISMKGRISNQSFKKEASGNEFYDKKIFTIFVELF